MMSLTGETLLDTDIFSDIVRGRPEVETKRAQYFQKHGLYTISVMTLGEVVAGFTQTAKPRQSSVFGTLRSALKILPINDPEAEVAGLIMGHLRLQGLAIGKIDPFIAATAITHGLPLVTANTNHYQRVVDIGKQQGFQLQLENWREP